MASIKLEIVSPDRVVYSDDIAMLIVRSTGGELGILPHHAPLVTGLLPHAMHVKFPDREELIAVSGGFMEVQPEKITVLASAAEEPIDIDINAPISVRRNVSTHSAKVRRRRSRRRSTWSVRKRLCAAPSRVSMRRRRPTTSKNASDSGRSNTNSPTACLSGCLLLCYVLMQSMRHGQPHGLHHLHFFSLTVRNAFSAAAIVRLMSSSVWASERKSVSNCEGAR